VHLAPSRSWVGAIRFYGGRWREIVRKSSGSRQPLRFTSTTKPRKLQQSDHWRNAAIVLKVIAVKDRGMIADPLERVL
jgi:hypothetical protein